MISIGIIGNGGHSRRIQKILKKKKLKYFIYKPDRPKYFDKSGFAKLKKCKAIFIVSPNNTHYQYIHKLRQGRYIFCEKPPVTNLKDLNKLKKINNGKIYFNFNFRFLKISEILKNTKKYNLGNLLYANLISSHGLSLKKKEYFNSWRSNINKCPSGVFEIVSIHYIDLINFFFDIKNFKGPKLINYSGIGTSFDTSHVELKLKNDSIINIFVTYNSAYIKKFFFLFSNGFIEQNNNQIFVKGPAMNFDKKGFFKYPKTIIKYNIKDNKDYETSLFKSVSIFLNHVKKNKNFSNKSFNTSIKSNKLLLK